MRQVRPLGAFVTVAIVVGIVFAWTTVGLAAPFADVQLFIEFNSTDNDGGIHAFLDGDAWREVKIFSPDGRPILAIEAKRGAFRRIGLTELRFESAEPSLAEILAEFPPGEYEFTGETVEGEELEGTATLSHEIPTPPEIVSPPDGGLVDPDNTVIEWSHPGNGVASFQVIVEPVDGGASMTVDLSASTTSLKVSPEFLQGNTDYKFEVLAISENGNRTITESTFKTP